MSSSDNLPGFRAEDTREPLTPAEIKRRDKEYEAAVMYMQTGDLSTVRQKLGFKTLAEAKMWVNRGQERYGEELASRTNQMRGDIVMGLEDQLHALRPTVRTLIAQAEKLTFEREDGEIDHKAMRLALQIIREATSVVDSARGVTEHMAKLMALNEEREDAQGGITVISTQLPDHVLRGEIVDEDEPPQGEIE